MGVLALLNHVLNFLAPALWLAVCLPLLARWGVKKRKPRLLTQFVLMLVVGAVTLGAGLVLWGVDGKMLTYLALVVVCASTQWLLLRR